MSKKISIKYINSERQEIALSGKLLTIADANFHAYEYNPESSETRFGEKFKRLTKDSYEYPIKLFFTGSKVGIKERLKEFHDIIAIDRVNNQAGTLAWGDWQIEGLVIAEDVHPSENEGTVENDIVLYCPHPFWRKATEYNFSIAEKESGNSVKYPKRYPYRYATSAGSASLINPHFAPANMKLIIYGPIANPLIRIGDVPYLVNDALEESERFEIDTASETIYKIARDGQRINCFSKRQKGRDFFQKIPTGRQDVVWNNKFAFDVIIYEERSVPVW